MGKQPSVFVSYSWDSKEHQEWVSRLVDDLEANGVKATFDKKETQKKTINLYRMMVSAFKDYDFVILVLTENYAKKADQGEGGVGFETNLSYQFLNENDDKLIFIARGDMNKVFPTHLKGYYAIDFTNSKNYEEKLEELLNRIKSSENKSSFSMNKNTKNRRSSVENFEIPDIKEITDMEKEKFMKDSFTKIRDGLDNLFLKIKEKNNNFEYVHEKASSNKSIFKLYKNGNFVEGIKIWLCNIISPTTYKICISYGKDLTNDNSMNEQLTFDITEDNQLKLKYNFSGNFINKDKLFWPDEIVKIIWEYQIKNKIKR